MENLLTLDECRIVMKTYLKHDDFIIDTYRIVPFDKPLNGLIGEHYYLYIDFNTNNQQHQQQRFFVKTLNNNRTMSEISKQWKVYEKEEFFYKFLKQKFDNDPKLDTSYLPNYYYSRPYLIVLEDCVASNYRSSNKKLPLDLEHCKICLGVLAKFHTTSLIYEKNANINLSTNFDILENQATGSRYVDCAIKSLYDLIDEFESNPEEFKTKLTKVLMENNEVEATLTTLLHGDLWTSNFLYLYQDNRPILGKLLDYQTIYYGPPQKDLLQFLMTNLRKDLRNQHYRELIEFYYDEFLANLLNYYGSIDDHGLPTKLEFVQSCEDFKIYGKLHAIIDHSITFISEENYLKILKSEDGLDELLFDQRGRCVIEQCRQDADYKNLLLEDLSELRDLL